VHSGDNIFLIQKGSIHQSFTKFRWVFKQEKASVPNAFQWWVKLLNEAGSITYKKATCPTFFSSHAWECCQSVITLPAAVKGGQHKTHSNFMHAWQVSTTYFAQCPEWLLLQTTCSTRDQKFWQAPRNLPSVSGTMVSNQDMPDILTSNMAKFYFQILLLRNFDIRPQKHHECPWTTPTILSDVSCCQSDYCTLYLGRPLKMKTGKSHHYIHMIKILLIPTAHSLPQDKNLWTLPNTPQPTQTVSAAGDLSFEWWPIISLFSWPNYSKHFVWWHLKGKVVGQNTYRSYKWQSEMKSPMIQKKLSGSDMELLYFCAMVHSTGKW
jgi:hypothetical protein